MKNFFKGVRKHIDRLDAGQLREQYGLVADEIEFLDRIFDTLDRGILTLTVDGEVVFSNPCARELLGMDPADAVKTLEIPLGKSSRREFEISYPTVRQIESSTIPMKNGQTLVVLRDVTAERTRTEEELRAGATEAVRELASGVAHEIGNPLNALSLTLQMMQREPQKDDEGLAVCRQQIERLDGILKGFLAALRPSKPNLAPGNAAAPLLACLKAMQTQLEERRIATTVDAPSALPSVALDADQMQQVYFNLLKNALEAMKDGGAIAIAVAADDDTVSVTIRDSGAGMPPEQVAHLFKPYRTTKEHGTGLGLMVSARIVRDHGGTIDVVSEVGVGTTFAVRLPRLEKRVRALTQRPDGRAASMRPPHEK